MYRINHTGSGLWIPGQLPKRGVNLRYRPLPQWLSCTTRTNRICSIQCGTTLRIPQAQDARTSRGYNSQWKHRPLSPYRRAHCSPCGRSTMRPPPANHQSGDDNLKLRQARAEHPAARSASTTRAGLAVQPPLKSHQSSIRAMRTQLCTQNTMGTGGGVAVARSTIHYCSVTFSFTFKDMALVKLLRKSRIVGLI